MTPSGAPTVTGWVQFRVRAASLTRTKGRAVPPRCAVMSRTARLPLLPSMYEKKLDFSFLFIYLFSIIYLFIIFFVNLFGLFIFRLFVSRCFKHLPVAFATFPFTCLLSLCSCHAV